MVFEVNGMLVDITRVWRVEVENKREMEAVEYYAKLHDRKFKKGKTHGKPGQYRLDCYVEADFHDLREKVRDTLSRIIGHDVIVYATQEMELNVL